LSLTADQLKLIRTILTPSVDDREKMGLEALL
jgi:hypothetical protein